MAKVLFVMRALRAFVLVSPSVVVLLVGAAGAVGACGGVDIGYLDPEAEAGTRDATGELESFVDGPRHDGATDSMPESVDGPSDGCVDLTRACEDGGARADAAAGDAADGA